MPEEEQERLKKENEEIRIQKEKIVEKISDKFSAFKRDFIGAPMRRALKCLQTGEGQPSQACEISYRNDEKYWVIPSKTEVTVSFSLQFDNPTDKALARIFLLEFVDSKRHVQNPPSILYYDNKFPEAVVAKFPEAAKIQYSNGVISFSKLSF